MVQIFDDLDKFMDNLGMNQKEEAAPEATEAKQ
jgi:hypothetical protein